MYARIHVSIYASTRIYLFIHLSIHLYIPDRYIIYLVSFILIDLYVCV